MKKIVLLLAMLTVSYSHAEEREALEASVKKEIIEVLKVNENLHQSFFEYNAKEVEKQSQALKQAIDKISHSEIAKRINFSKKKLSEIKSDTDRDKNNQSYHLVSMALIHIVKSYDLGSDYQAYSCPMVKMQWLQNTKKVAKVHNPYTPEMPHCGGKDMSL